MITDCSLVGGSHKGYQESKDSIGIFLNFKLVAEYKNKGEARAKIKKMLEEVPKELKKEFDEFQDYLYRAL